jgi:hypothetical protein
MGATAMLLAEVPNERTAKLRALQLAENVVGPKARIELEENDVCRGQLPYVGLRDQAYEQDVSRILTQMGAGSEGAVGAIAGARNLPGPKDVLVGRKEVRWISERDSLPIFDHGFILRSSLTKRRLSRKRNSERAEGLERRHIR